MHWIQILLLVWMLIWMTPYTRHLKIVKAWLSKPTWQHTEVAKNMFPRRKVAPETRINVLEIKNVVSSVVVFFVVKAIIVISVTMISSGSSAIMICKMIMLGDSVKMLS